MKVNINDPSSIDGLDTIEVTLEDLYVKLTNDLISPTKEDIEDVLKRTQEATEIVNVVADVQPSKTKNKKKESQGNNKIILNL